jgi:hypothetical protein
MRPFITTFLIVSFVAIAVFGFTAMNHEHQVGCLAEAASGQSMPCPAHDAVGFLEFHLNAFKAFSLAIFGKIVDILIILALALVSIPLRRFLFFLASVFLAVRRRIREKISFYKEQLIRWLCLFELSPSFLSMPR